MWLWVSGLSLTGPGLMGAVHLKSLPAQPVNQTANTPSPPAPHQPQSPPPSPIITAPASPHPPLPPTETTQLIHNNPTAPSLPPVPISQSSLSSVPTRATQPKPNPLPQRKSVRLVKPKSFADMVLTPVKAKTNGKKATKVAAEKEKVDEILRCLEEEGGKPLNDDDYDKLAAYVDLENFTETHEELDQDSQQIGNIEEDVEVDDEELLDYGSEEDPMDTEEGITHIEEDSKAEGEGEAFEDEA